MYSCIHDDVNTTHLLCLLVTYKYRIQIDAAPDLKLQSKVEFNFIMVYFNSKKRRPRVNGAPRSV